MTIFSHFATLLADIRDLWKKTVRKAIGKYLKATYG